MKSVMRMRHYCDFCKKSAGTKPSMEKHEQACTGNPDRVCRMCVFGGLEQQSMEVLQAAYAKGFKSLAEAATHCPACILAAQRQFWGSVPPDYWKVDDPRDSDRFEWDFKTASKAFLAEHQPERGEYY